MEKLIRTERIWLKSHPEITEGMIENIISDNPSILELGDIILKDRQRRQPHAGRLDMLLQDEEDNRRYEVEIQLGQTDESHIIRTIEYWDIEKKRFPQYDHCAVLIAEDITSRFLNVISLFNGTIPLIAIQLNAFKVNDQIALSFVKVLDEMQRGLVDEDEEIQIKATPEYWEQRSSKEMLKLVDEVFALVKEQYPNTSLNYNKGYIGILLDGKPVNFVVFNPKRQSMTLELKIKFSEEMSKRIDDSGLERLSYNNGFKYYPIRLTKGGAEKYQNALIEFIRLSYENRVSGN